MAKASSLGNPALPTHLHHTSLWRLRENAIICHSLFRPRLKHRETVKGRIPFGRAQNDSGLRPKSKPASFVAVG
jgi:hypothetical protein